MYTLMNRLRPESFFFFFNDTATTEIYTLSLHDALPICSERRRKRIPTDPRPASHLESVSCLHPTPSAHTLRSEEHTSELQSQSNLVCRLLLEKKKRRERGGSEYGATAQPPSVRAFSRPG